MQRSQFLQRTLSVLLVCVTSGGCGQPWGDDRPTLVIATYLDRQARNDLALAFADASVRWIVLGPEDPLGPVLDPTARVDILLGGPIEAFRHLAGLGHFAEVDGQRLRALDVDLADRSTTWLEGKSRGLDPRTSAHVLRSWIGKIDQGPPLDWYKRVLDQARGGKPDLPRPGQLGIYREGVAVLATGLNPGPASAFVRFLVKTNRAEPAPGDLEIQPGADDLLADLLGAAVVDARSELDAADRVLRQTGHPEVPETRLVEPPPWPPASVTRILARPDGGPLLDVLAEQLVPSPKPRAWLLRSWTAPPRPLDRKVLSELADAEEGRLLREPRFRAWLRAEWTAWARQRYRRVSRLASGEWKGPRLTRPTAKESPTP